MLTDLLNKIESYEFECVGGPLTNCQDWQRLRESLSSAQSAGVQEETPPEILASRLIDAWVADKGKIPWAKAVQIVTIVTKQPDAERDRLLKMGDDDKGICEMCGRSDYAAASAKAQWISDEDAITIVECRNALVKKDTPEAYHQLYTLVGRHAATPYNVWAELEAISAAASEQRGGGNG